MFDLGGIEPVEYRTPWDLGFDERLGLLERSRRRIAYLYDVADNSTFRYRVYNPVQVVNGLSDTVSAGYFFAADRPHFARIADSADLLVMCRTKYSDVVNSIATQFRNRGKPVVYDIDDLVFDPAWAHLVARTIGHPLRDDAGWSEWFGYVARCGTAMRLCDGCIATNDRLAAHIETFLGKPVKVLQNFINREQLALSDRIWAAKAAQRFRGDCRVDLG